MPTENSKTQQPFPFFCAAGDDGYPLEASQTGDGWVEIDPSVVDPESEIGVLIADLPQLDPLKGDS